MPVGDTNVPAVTTAENPSTPAQETEKLVPSAAPAVFHVLGLPVTNSMISTWVVAAFILIVVRVTTLEEYQGSAVGNAKRPGIAGGSLGRLDRGYFGQTGDALGFSFCHDIFHFHRRVELDGFNPGRGQHWIFFAG